MWKSTAASSRKSWKHSAFVSANISNHVNYYKEVIIGKCLIVGGAGFIGSAVSNLLVETGREVVALGRSPSASHMLSKKAAYVSGDCNDRSLLRKLLKETDELIDLAYATVPKTSFDDPVYDILSNLPIGVSLIEEAYAAHLKKMVFVSSGGTVYGVAQSLPIREDHPTNPISPYGITKLTLEKYILMFSSRGLPAVIVRPGNAYGERQQAFAGQGFIATAIQSVLLRQTVNIFGKNGAVRDYIHVEDVARGVIAALDFGKAGDIYNIGSGVGMTNMDILKNIRALAEQSNYPVRINIMPEREFDVPVNILDSAKLRSISTWRPEIGFNEGVNQTWLTFVERSRKAKFQLQR